MAAAMGMRNQKKKPRSSSFEQIKQFLNGKSQAEKVALRNNPKIKPIVERIEAEKASKKANVDTDAMLGELEG